MPVIAEARATATANGSGHLNPIDANTSVGAAVFAPGVFVPGVFTLAEPAGDFAVNATVLADEIFAVKPRRRVQYVGLEVKVGGVDVRDSMLAGSFRVSRSLDRPIQVASLGLAILDGRSALGDGLRLAAPASGLKPIDVAFNYRAPSGKPFRVPLITNGIADETELQANGGVTESLSIADAGRRFRDKTVTRIIPAGSNLSRDNIIAKLAKDAGVLTHNLPRIPGRVTKPVELLEGDWLALSRDQADVPGYAVLWDPEDNLTAIENAAEQPRPKPKWVFTESDLVRSVNGASQNIVIRPSADAWTEIELRGHQQVTRDSCSLQTKTLRSFGLVDEVAPVYTFLQSASNGSVTNLGFGILIGSRIGSRTITQITSRCRDIITEKIRSWALFNPTIARYRKNADGTQKPAGSGGFNQVYLLNNAADEVGHAYVRPRLLKVEEVTTDRVFIAGVLRRVVKETRSWYNPRRHIKSRALPETPWENQSADSDFWDLGNGEAVTDRRDSFRLTERETIELTPAGDGTLRSRRTKIERYAKREGGRLYLYGDGSESSDSEEQFRVVSELQESWTQITEELVAVSVVRFGLDRKWLDSVHGLDAGGPPAAEQLENAEPLRSSFDTDAEFEAARAASRFEQEEIIAECSAPGLLALRPERKLQQSLVEWAENVDELRDICNRYLLLGMSPTIEFTVAPNGRLREGDLVHLRLRQPGVGLDHDCKVVTVNHQGTVGGAKITRARGLLWADRSQLGFGA